VTAIRIKLIDELGDQVPEKFDFNVGYYEGKQQAKISTEDLKMMYSNHSKGDITLWCDGRDTKETRGKSNLAMRDYPHDIIQEDFLTRHWDADTVTHMPI